MVVGWPVETSNHTYPDCDCHVILFNGRLLEHALLIFILSRPHSQRLGEGRNNFAALLLVKVDNLLANSGNVCETNDISI